MSVAASILLQPHRRPEILGSTTYRNILVILFGSRPDSRFVRHDDAFDDEFNSHSISLTGARTTWSDSRNEQRAGNTDVGFGSSVFVDPKAGYDPFNVSNGILTITAKPNTTVPSSLAKWESGMITTQNSFTQTYGYFEMRADLASTVGAWDAFWLLPTTEHPVNGNWQEIDVVEHYDDDDKAVYNTIHTTDPLPAGHSWQNDYQVVSTEANPSGYHTYLMWTASTLSFYVDGNLVGSKPTPSDMHSPMFLLANLATQTADRTPPIRPARRSRPELTISAPTRCPARRRRPRQGLRL